MKEQDKTPEEPLNEVEIGNLLEKRVNSNDIEGELGSRQHWSRSLF